MHAVQAPIQPGDKGAAVANLQDVLSWLHRHGVIKTFAPPDQPTAEALKALFDRLGQERASDQTFGDATRALVQLFQVQQGLGDQFQGAVESSTAERLNQWLLETGAAFDGGLRVFGCVTNPRGMPQERVWVHAWDRDLRRRQLLGTTTTDAAGRYCIDYTPTDFANADPATRKVPWLVMEARRSADGEVLGSIELKPAHVSTQQQVDLKVPELEPEYTRLLQAVLPLLKGQGRPAGTDLQPHELGSGDLSFLAEETGFHLEALEAFIAAAHMLQAAKAVLHARPHAALLRLLASQGGDWFYAMARQGLADKLPAALLQDAQAWTEAWDAAVANGQVTPVTTKVQAQLLDGMAQIRRLQQP